MVSKEDMAKLLKMRQKLYEMGELSVIEMQSACTPALSIAAWNQLKPYLVAVFEGQMEYDKAKKKWKFIYTENQIKVALEKDGIQAKIDDKL